PHDIAHRIAAFDWSAVEDSLDRRGYATLPGVLAAAECADLAALYDDDARFRSRVVMRRHNFGEGEYKYLSYPLPPVVEALRQACYRRLVPVADRWRAALRESGRFPPALDDYLARCHAAGQTRPTPLILRYEAGGYNCLHQDLYGELVFPLQMTALLSAPGRDFTGGEFLLMEQRPRAQSRGEVVPLDRGDAVIFAVRHRPAQGTRGSYRVTLRHGVSRVVSGTRCTLGVIFHDAA
ncbi:MAG: 2OG-Fe(II) oxygenase, partial [Acidobacteriota bacterium]